MKIKENATRQTQKRINSLSRVPFTCFVLLITFDLSVEWNPFALGQMFDLLPSKILTIDLCSFFSRVVFSLLARCALFVGSLRSSNVNAKQPINASIFSR